MRESKRKRLQAKGWKVGSAKEFLELSDEEDAYIELRLKLAEGLKARRLGRGLTQVQLAKAVRSSQSRVAKMESGDPTVSLDLLVRSLLALGTTNRELAADHHATFPGRITFALTGRRRAKRGGNQTAQLFGAPVERGVRRQRVAEYIHRITASARNKMDSGILTPIA